LHETLKSPRHGKVEQKTIKKLNLIKGGFQLAKWSPA
jgi:hypothetical protein